MNPYNSMVKCYKRKNGEQYLITLKKGHPFKENEKVIILPKSEINEYKKDNINLENEIKLRNDTIRDLNKEVDDYKAKIEELEKLNTEIANYKEKLEETQDKYYTLLNDHDKLRNSKDHLQERFNKSQEEVIKLERELNSYRIAMTKVQALSFMDRLLNRLPEEIKQLPETET